MSVLQIFNEQGQAVEAAVNSHDKIAHLLAEKNVQFEQWSCGSDLAEDAGQEEILEAYNNSINKLKSAYSFKSIDVVALQPDNPQKEEFRQKFLAEHTHADFEIRFFVDGSGVFYLHLDNMVYVLLCRKGDLISVPANTTHWFDMGSNPSFKCIRLFTTEDGWIGNFTGSDIASRFPDMDQFVASVS